MEYETRSVYGRNLHYILSPDKAQVWYTLTGKRTMTDADLVALRQLGLTLVEVSGGVHAPMYEV